MVPVQTFVRKVIRIKAEDSPNVRLGLAQQRAGMEPTNEELVPGVLSWAEFVYRRTNWDDIRQCVGLDAAFWKGKEVLLFPPQWLNYAEFLGESYKNIERRAEAIGVDPAEGGDSTAMAAVDKFGLIELVSKKTPDTSVIRREVAAFAKKHHLSEWEQVVFDRGGGGTQIASEMRKDGMGVRTIAFGTPVTAPIKRSKRSIAERMKVMEEKYAYKNMRAYMYGSLSELLDLTNESGFSLQAEYTVLRRELAPIPRTYDKEGRLELLPKHKNGPNDTRKTLVDLIGHSPDQADALVLAVHGMLHPQAPVMIGAPVK